MFPARMFGVSSGCDNVKLHLTLTYKLGYNEGCCDSMREQARLADMLA